MYIAPFGVEQWMNEWETGAVANLAETCVDSMTAAELLDLSGRREEILEQMMDLRLSYGDILGSDEIRELIASLYDSADRENVVVMNGGAAANFIAMFTLVSPGDEVISVYPTYQQLYSIPEAFGASVKLLRLRYEDDFQLDIGALEKLVTDRTKVICVNNSNNPTGSLMKEPLLREITRVADSVGAWLYCDEAYRFMVHDPGVKVPSAADLYEKSIVSCGLSKCFSLAGLRLGWLVAPKQFIRDVADHRDYTTISCGRLDDLLGRVAIKNREKIFARNLKIVRKCASVLEEWVRNEPRVGCVKPECGTTAFLRYDYDIASEDFCKRLFKKDGTFLLPGKCFGPEFDRFLRVGYAYEPGVLASGLKKVSGFLRELEAEET
ncbi:MAG: aminotransferase class I/II-fold pyridoxal phosphate-dependent enzyme [Synergistaceae bacterium]|jgi:aspartate/methionine/tyrosine aminotransferase|nr:aminotransferase class I/II-fold pyridoxal phosphate-dependent enzyme [Synergistaceae bacterium]